MKILLIEDQADVVDFIVKGLRSEGFSVTSSFDGKEGLTKFKKEHPDLIILDVNLPTMNGFEVCAEVRKKGDAVPIIMLTARDTIEDKITGLDIGADDYLCKPFSLRELSARIRALARRRSNYQEDTLCVGDLVLDTAAHEAVRGKRNIELSPTELRLLRYLMENSGKVISKPMILEHVWEYNFDPGTNIVDVYIQFLRNKIDRGRTKKMIKTVRGVGYKLCG